MKYHDLRDFLTLLEQQGELKRITLPVDPHLEITEIADRTLRAGGPALLFENPKGYTMPVLCNLFGTPRRVALGMGQEDVSSLREVGKLLAFLKEPEPPKGFRDLFDKLPQFKQVLNMPTKRLRGAPCQAKIIQGDDVDLNKIPIMTCWPEDAAPLITWGVDGNPRAHKERQNLGIYRQQLIGKNKLIMRLAVSSRRRAGFPGVVRGASGRTLPGFRGAWRRSGNHSWRGDAGARYPVGICFRRPAARHQDRSG